MNHNLAQFLDIPSPGADRADALLLPLPVEKTVCYGRGAGGGPEAIIKASSQIETFDEETLVEFTEAPRTHTLPPPSSEGEIEDCLSRINECVRPWRGRFLLALGGEHTVTYGVVTGMVEDPAEVTVVQIDAHADLADRLDGRRWSHGTVMRRLWERGCRLVQIGVRSLSREEYGLASANDRITTYYAHRLKQQWPEVLESLRSLKGKTYLTIDVDGFDPSLVPSTGTPLPGGLSWDEAMEVVRVLTSQSSCRLIGGDVVEFVPSPNPPGCDPTVARLTSKLLAWWWSGRGKERR
ncbi:MAG: agmatinase [Pirellulales bacterium]|nr:agmatinase [Pirellulales bacterium]